MTILSLSIDKALETFDGLCDGLDAETVEKHRLNLPGCIEAGAAALQTEINMHGPIDSTQQRVEHQLNPGGLMWLGYIDIQLEDGLVIDLKYTAKRPSRMPGGHARQGAFYSIATDCPVKFIYVVPLKAGASSVTLQLDPSEVPGRIAELAAAERAIAATLALADTPLDLAPAMYPDPDHYSLKGPMERAIAADLWGLHQPMEAA